MVLTVKDIETTASFYPRVLGMDVIAFGGGRKALSLGVQKVRWHFGGNKWIGFAVGLLVPIVHLSERKGGFVIGVSRGEPYFTDIPKL